MKRLTDPLSAARWSTTVPALLRSALVLAALTLLQLHDAARAQSSLTTTFANNNNGAPNGAVYFDLAVSAPAVTIVGLEVNLNSPAGTTGSVDVYVTPGTRSGQQTNPAAWLLLASGACTAAGPGLPTQVTTQSFALSSTVGIALVANGVSFAYTNGNGSNQTYSDPNLLLSAGEASNQPFTPSLFQQRVANLRLWYLVGAISRPDDNCNGAGFVTTGTNGTYTNSGYTASAPSWPCGVGGSDRWFRFVAPVTASFEFNTCGSGLDTLLEVFSGSCSGGLTSLGCSDNDCGAQSRITLALSALQVVYVRVGGASGQTGSFTLAINQIAATLQAGFTASPTAGNAPLVVNFTDTSTATGLPITSWQWDFENDGIIDSTLQNPSHTFAQGSYDVALTVSNGVTAPSTIVQPNFIAAAFLQANFSGAPTTGAAPLTVNFVDQSITIGAPITLWEWDFENDGIVDSNQANPSHTYGPGTYDVRLTVSNGISPPSTLIQPGLVVSANAQASFVANPAAGTAPLTVSFTDTSSVTGTSITGWEWDFDNDGTTDSQLQNPTHTFGAGVHDIRLTIHTTVTPPSTVLQPAAVSAIGMSGDVVFNELVYDAPASDRFIELFNRTSNSISLAGWQIVGVTPNQSVPIVFATVSSGGIAPGGYFVFDAAGPHQLSTPLPTGAASIELRDQGGMVIDRLAYEAADGALPAASYQGNPLFGAHIGHPGVATSWTRQDDGFISDFGTGPVSNNGFEWRIATATPGATNHLPNNKSDIAESYGLPGTGGVSFWRGCQAPPVNQASPPVPASPDGGGHVFFDAPSPGSGRSYYFETAAADNFKLNGWVWLDIPSGLAPGERCAWSMGVCGTTDSEYEFPDPWREVAGPDKNGDTGVAWTFEVTRASSTSTPVGRLSLVDNEAGGTDHVVLWSTEFSNSQWYFLGLGVAPESLNIRLGSPFADDMEWPHYDAYGGVYIGVRKSTTQPFGLRLDGVTVDASWNSHDTSGAGCSGNCPPLNPRPRKLDRSTAPANTKYAIYVPNNSLGWSSSQLCFYMAPFKSGTATPPRVTLHAVTGPTGNELPGGALTQTHSLDADGLDWWIANFNYTHTSGADFFLVLELDDTMRPPIVAGSGLETARYRAQPHGASSYGAFATDTFAWTWSCADDSSDIIADANTDETVDMPTIDFSVTYANPAPLAAVHMLGFSQQFLPLDPFGAPTCAALVIPLATTFVALPGPGPVLSTTTLPAGPLPIGLSFESQWAVLDLSYNPLGLRTSNRRTVTIR
ncbi:MAG: PKD domain-containing protein [bacterium]|nr:PKD domain-containing protein [bacterium]